MRVFNTSRFFSPNATAKDRMYSQSPAKTVIEFPQCEFADGRPLRVSAASMMSSCTKVALWMNSTTAARRIAIGETAPNIFADGDPFGSRCRIHPQRDQIGRAHV